MVEHNYNGVTYKLNTCWNEVTMKELIESNKISETDPVKAFAMLIGMDVNELNRLPLSEVNKINSICSFVKEPFNDVLTSFTINDESYSIRHSVTNIEFGQFINLESYVNKLSHWDSLVHIFVTLYLKDTDRPSEDVVNDCDRRAELFMSLSGNVVLACRNFFLILLNYSIENLQTFSNRLIEMTNQNINDCLSNIAGLESAMILQITTLLKSIQYKLCQ